MVLTFLIGGLLGAVSRFFPVKKEPMQKVYFFGGYAASINQVNSWAAAAKKMKPSYDFEGLHFVSKHDGEEPVVEDAKEQIALVVKLIEDSSRNDTIIVGHSSGCAVANEVARQIPHKVLKLIVLDGYAPSWTFQKEVPTECWYAVNGKIQSLNATEMQKQKDPKKHTNPYVRTLWALHFSLVNSNVPPDLAFKEYPEHGYDNIAPMLDYLP